MIAVPISEEVTCPMVYFDYIAYPCFIKVHLILNFAPSPLAYTSSNCQTSLFAYLLTCVTAGIAKFCNSPLKQ